jgi:starch synthase (maltosyl-transferring)
VNEIPPPARRAPRRSLRAAPRPQPGPPARVVIEEVSPEINGGRFAIKRTVGEDVDVTADVYAEGHDYVAAVLRYRYAGAAGDTDGPWHEVSMEELGNDRWGATFRVERPGRYEYSIQAWPDTFRTWREGVAKKAAAGQDVSLELTEGRDLLQAAASRLTRAAPGDTSAGRSREASGRPRQIGSRRTRASGTRGAAAADGDRHSAAPAETRALGRELFDLAELLAHTDVDRALDIASGDRVSALMARAFDRSQATGYQRTLSVWVDRERARFGTWYEMFPRSAGPDPTRSASFDEAARRLPDIAGMGFDVLYLPPIHPIGRSFRKGRNNTSPAAPGDPGSPWAIGGPEGGHKAIEPELGTEKDFDRFVATAKRLGLEIALDLAYQCSADHPYVREHPEWFRHRPDGSIQYAENPPKKYQDIYPLDFATRDWQALWEELKSIVLYWIERDVAIFRVDNPHTKPFAFWEWLIAEIHKDHPEVIFLSEAFTRPKVMKHLAKLGFTQSYTYFTWRNTKAELVDYFTELTRTDAIEYLRPNLFVNTPDILTEYLQHGGRPAFQVRLVLAATLGASYGMYSGFEVCENRAVRPGSEEYLDSEKYQYRQWDWSEPGNITELISLVNQIRRANPALQSDRRLEFHDTDNDQLIAYSKSTRDLSNILLMVVNLDPQNLQHGWVRVPIEAWNLDPAGLYAVDDLITGDRYFWQGEWNYVRLDPAVRPAHILEIRTQTAEAHDAAG